MSILKWSSTKELYVDGIAWSVETFDDSIRKQAALVKRTGSVTELVAYFKDEHEARLFAAHVLGPIKDYDQ